MILFLEKIWTDDRGMDRLFYRTFPATARGPITMNKFKFGKASNSSLQLY